MVSTHAPAGGTRERIRRTALDFFCERGYEKTSLREISEKLGVTKAALYYHFRTKEDILLSLCRSVIDELDQLLAWAGERPRSLETKREVLTRYSAVLGDAAPLVAMLQQNHATLSGLSVGQEIGDRTDALAEALKDPEAPVEAQVRAVSSLLTLHFGAFTLRRVEGEGDQKRKALLACALDTLNAAYDT